MFNTHLRHLQLPEIFTIYLRCLLFIWDVHYLPEMLTTTWDVHYSPEMFKDTWDNHYSPEIGLWVQQSLGPGRDADKHWGGGSWWWWGRGWGRHLLSCVNNRSISHCCDTSVTRINNKNQIDWYTGCENSKNTKSTTTKLNQRKYVLIYQIYQIYNDTSYHSFFYEFF